MWVICDTETIFIKGILPVLLLPMVLRLVLQFCTKSFEKNRQKKHAKIRLKG